QVATFTKQAGIWVRLGFVRVITPFFAAKVHRRIAWPIRSSALMLLRLLLETLLSRPCVKLWRQLLECVIDHLPYWSQRVTLRHALRGRDVAEYFFLDLFVSSHR